jgi:hypothetical protein
MARASTTTTSLPTAEESLLAIATLLIEERDARTAGDKGAPRIEVLLAATGLSHAAIASMTGKNEPAVRMAISRASGAGRASGKADSKKAK